MERAVIWDMDGTIVDSLGHHWLAWKETAELEGFPLEESQFLSTLGRCNDEILVEWVGTTLSRAERDRIGLEKEERYRTYVRTRGVEALPGVMPWISRLKADGWKLAIGTAAPRLNEEAVVDALGLAPWFDVRVVAEDVSRGKPFPDIFITAASRLGIDPSRAIVIEDAPAGITAAHTAGMRAVGVNASGPMADADIWVPSLTDLPSDALDQLLQSA